MAATISAVAPPSTAWRNCICSSRSADTEARIGEFLRVLRLVQKDFERGKLGVPLYKRGHRTEAAERRGMEVPDRFGDSGAMVVDQNFDTFGSMMTSKMDLADCLNR